FGSAILATVFQRRTAGYAASDLQVVSNAFNVSFWWAIGFAVVAAIPTLFLTKPGKPEPETTPKEAEQRQVASGT
ncbi:MAG TPA: hypothetical protein VFH83_07045, partial [Spirochaetia bacterium]|nr:hypothetical protein [Spirochaetia bacterium]